MIVRSSPFIEIGGFDESFFLYFEDADLTQYAKIWIMYARTFLVITINGSEVATKILD